MAFADFLDEEMVCFWSLLADFFKWLREDELFPSIESFSGFAFCWWFPVCEA